MLVKVKINKDGFKEFGAFIKANLTDEQQDILASILDDTFEFSGLAGEGIELVDKKLFKIAIKTGLEQLFPDEQAVNPS
jgi:hypothetical protein